MPSFKYAHWLFLASLPLVLLGLNPAWIFTPPGIDAWIYYGYYFNFPTYIEYFPEAYFGNRFSVFLWGSLTHQFLPPLLANYLLHLGLYYVVIFAHYALLKRLIHPQGALFGSMILGCYAPFLGAIGWNYTDTYIIPYLLLCYLCLLYGMEKRMGFIAAGVAFAAACHANPVIGILGPFLAILLIRAKGFRWQDFAWIGVGGLGLTLVLSLISVAVGGKFLFFMDSIRYMLTRSNEAGNSAGWHGDGLGAAHHAALILVSAGACLWFLWHSASESRLIRLFWAYHLSITGVFLLVELLKIYPFLSVHYYANFLLPSAFIALNLMIFKDWQAVSQLRTGFILPFLGLTLALWLTGGRELMLVWSEDNSSSLVVTSLILLAGFIFLLRQKQSLIGLTLFCFCIGIVGYRSVARPTYSANAVSDLGTVHQDFLLAVYDGIQKAQDYQREKPIYFWFDNDPEYPFYALASAHVNPNSFIGIPFNGIYEQTQLYPEMRIAILSRDGNTFESARQKLHERLWKAEFLGEERLFYGQKPFYMTFIEIQLCGSNPLPALPDFNLPESPIFYPGSDWESAPSSFPAVYDCLIDENLRGDYLEMLSLFSQLRPEWDSPFMEDWRRDKNPVFLKQAGIRYLFITDEWKGWLNESDYARFDDPEQYKLLREWRFPRLNNAYFLYEIPD